MSDRLNQFNQFMNIQSEKERTQSEKTPVF